MSMFLPVGLPVLVVSSLLLVAPCPAQDDWKTVLDGKSLNGWRVIGETAQVAEVEEGIRLGWKGGLVYVGETLKDFELRAQMKTRNDLNSGIFIHTSAEGADIKKNWEVQIANSKDSDKAYYTGAVYLITPPQTRSPSRDGEWFELTLRVEGTRITTLVDGKTIEDADTAGKGPATLGSGYFSFQPPRKEGSELIIRKIELRPIAPAPASNLTGAPSMIPKVEVASVAEVKELRTKFEEAWRTRVATPYRTGMGRLLPEYLAAIDAAAQDAQKAGNLDALIEYREERNSAEAVLTAVIKAPTELAAGREPELPPLAESATGPVKDLRKVWDVQFSALVQEKENAAAALQKIYLESLQKIEADLTRENRVDDALQVRKYREGL